jgi:regulator of protease activity HflC (stomatin/prohibitin superfamily)
VEAGWPVSLASRLAARPVGAASTTVACGLLRAPPASALPLASDTENRPGHPVQNYRYAMWQVAQTSLRSVIGGSDMDQLLSERDKVNAHLKDVIEPPSGSPGGIRVERVKIKDISLPESMRPRGGTRHAGARRGHSQGGRAPCAAAMERVSGDLRRRRARL